MASPQLENGYTRIANEILEQVVKRPFAERQCSIIFHVMRMTYGWGVSMAEISLTQFESAIGVKSAACSVIIQRLIKLKVLLAEVVPGGRRLGINKDYEKWGVLPRGALPLGILPAEVGQVLLARVRKGLPLEVVPIKKGKKTKESNRLPPVAYEYFINRWNAFAKVTGAPLSKPWTSSIFPSNRKENFRTQMENPAFEWETILRTAYRTKFVRDGCKGKKAWVTLDKIIKPRIWQRLLAGEYGPQTKPIRDREATDAQFFKPKS